MEKKRIRCRGFLLAELITATALLGLIIACLAVSMNGFSMVNDCQWTRQRCTAAAQAQIESLTATGKPIELQELSRLWPGVNVLVSVAPPPSGVIPAGGGRATWDGLELVQVTASAQAGSRKITVRLSRYYIGRAWVPKRDASRLGSLSPLATQGHAETHDLPSAVAKGGQF